MPLIKQFKNTWLGKIRKALNLTSIEMAQGLDMTTRGYLKAEAEKEPTTWSGQLLKVYIDEHGLDTLKKVLRKKKIQYDE